jgi:hypothetical protein
VKVEPSALAGICSNVERSAAGSEVCPPMQRRIELAMAHRLTTA